MGGLGTVSYRWHDIGGEERGVPCALIEWQSFVSKVHCSFPNLQQEPPNKASRNFTQPDMHLGDSNC